MSTLDFSLALVDHKGKRVGEWVRAPFVASVEDGKLRLAFDPVKLPVPRRLFRRARKLIHFDIGLNPQWPSGRWVIDFDPVPPEFLMRRPFPDGPIRATGTVTIADLEIDVSLP